MKPPRLFRAACATGAVICGVLAVLSASASAAGEFTTATLTSPTSGSSAVFTWNYEFHQNGGHGLSNLAVGFCDDSILSDVQLASQQYTLLTNDQGGHDGFDGVKFDVTAVTGTISVTFKHEHGIDPEGLLLQSHSGDGQAGDVISTAAGPGPCPDTPTENTIHTQVNPTTTTTAASTAPQQAVVLGETLTAPVQATELPRTGSDGLLTFILAGLSLILAGLACGGLPRLFRSG